MSNVCPEGYVFSWEQYKVGVWSCLPCAQEHKLQRGPGSPRRAGGAPQVFFHLQGPKEGLGQGHRQAETAAERRLVEQLKRGAPPLRTGSKIAPPPKTHTVRAQGWAKQSGDEVVELPCSIVGLDKHP